jgi:hypothetical protein
LQARDAAVEGMRPGIEYDDEDVDGWAARFEHAEKILNRFVEFDGIDLREGVEPGHDPAWTRALRAIVDDSYTYVLIGDNPDDEGRVEEGDFVAIPLAPLGLAKAVGLPSVLDRRALKKAEVQAHLQGAHIQGDLPGPPDWWKEWAESFARYRGHGSVKALVKEALESFANIVNFADPVDEDE